MPRSIVLSPLGVNLDSSAAGAPPDVWTWVRNMVAAEQSERVRGLLRVFGDPLFPPEHLLFAFNANDNPVTIYASVQGFGLFDGTTHTDITPAGFAAPVTMNPWSSGLLNGIPVIGAETFYYWPGAGPLLELPGWPATRRASTMRPYKFHLMALGIDEGGTLLENAVYWSAAAPPGSIPESWTPAADNEAGSTELGATDGVVIDGLALRSSFIVYKSRSTYVMDYVSGSSVMQTRPLFTESGILARNCVASFAGAHIVLTGEDVVIHDGTQIRSIADQIIRRSLFANMDNTHAARSFVSANEASGEVWVCTPEQGQPWPTIAHVWDRTSNKWGIRELTPSVAHIARGRFSVEATDESWESDSNAWDDDTTIWLDGAGRYRFNGAVEASVAGSRFLAVDLGEDFDGVPIRGVLRRSQLILEDAATVKTVTNIIVEAEGPEGVQLKVSIGANLCPADSALTSSGVFTVGASCRVPVFVTGRYFDVQIENLTDVGNQSPWRLTTLRLEYEQRGRF